MDQNLEMEVLAKLKGFLATAELPDDGRLPPERELAQSLDVGRAVLRKALATLQAEGTVWRHVGKGTFVGDRPIDTVADIHAMVQRTNPLEVMGARIAFEPEVTRCAALNATGAQIAEIRNCMIRHSRHRHGGNMSNGTTACTVRSVRPRRTHCCLGSLTR